jgi:membrane fusion protein (multidrug efflux system)
MRGGAGKAGRRHGGPAADRWAHASLLLLALAACRGDRGPGPAAQPVELDPRDVAIARVEMIQTGPYVSGSLRPRREATLRAELAAQVLATYAEKGDDVAEGELLARLDDAALVEAQRSAQRAVATAQQAAAFARANLRRAEVLFEAGGVARRDVEAARLDLANAEAQLADARSRLAQAEEQLARTEIRAPFSGRIAARYVGAGDGVQPGMNLYTVIDPTTMRLEAQVPAEQLGTAGVGTPVRFRVRGYPGRVFDGSIEQIGPAADSATRQIQVIVAIPNPDGSLVADLFADGHIESETRQGTVIPEDAVDETGPTPEVVVVRQGRTARIGVVLGIRDERTGRIEVTAGVFPGDTVLVGTARALTAGTPVVVRGGPGP